MTQRTLEDRVIALEREVAELKQHLTGGTRPKDWRRTIGVFAGNKLMKEIDEEARKIREAERQKARQQRKKPQRSKK